MSRFIISNGDSYVGIKNDGLAKVENINEARLFTKWNKCKNVIRTTPFCNDEWFYQEAYTKEMNEDPKNTDIIFTGKRFYPMRIKQSVRHGFPIETRKMIYEKSNGTCQLCGRKIIYDNMTIDHIIPLAMNGTSDIENLQCACEFCNSAKASVLPEDFCNRISGIFMYQMEQKYGNKLTWKLIKKILKMKYLL